MSQVRRRPGSPSERGLLTPPRDAWRPRALLLLAAVSLGPAGCTPDSEEAVSEPTAGGPQRVVFNDNVAGAGTLRRGELELTLEVRDALWHLLGDDEAPLQVLAFAEPGRAPTIPSPMIRVPAGTWVQATVHNPTDAPLVVHGLSSRLQTELDSLVVPAGGSAETRFLADVAGTYYYWATNTGTQLSGAPMERRVFQDSQLGGALIVDPAGGSPPDRVLFIGMLVDGRDEEGNPDGVWDYPVINGRPWPHTERMTYALGDTIRWRLVNGSYDVHPMHLHGFHYEVEARGDLARDTVFWPAERRVAVTERMLPGQTMTMAWVPNRPGGWLFHCHLSFHVQPNPRIGEARGTREERGRDIRLGHPDHDPHNHVESGMGGLMMAVQVEAPEGWVLDEPAERELRLFVTSDSTPGEPRRFAYVLQEDEHEPRPDSLHLPGSTLVLRRGEPTAIRVFNRSSQPTQIHWHGLELQSYYDGVVGVGGTPGMPTPAILPGESFEVRITPPRAGSFMYHTHMNDIHQQSHGLAGGFVVLEPDEAWDPDRDMVFVVATQRGTGVGAAMNGFRVAPTRDLRVGQTYRLRLMNATLAGTFQLRLLRDGVPELWVPRAKDGADLPMGLRVSQRADGQVITVGETMDFHYTPTEPGEVVLEQRNASYRLISSQAFRVLPGEGGP
jgi:FtsP/CotA-like multicopper oxidase with cupredoxin domain